ncbi:MAG: hypothetical protein H6563_07675 [Lewinellaceae bacterium]|nr:hypothetical protein [Lewinellaceae bacterium]
MKFWLLLVVYWLGSITPVLAQWDGEDPVCPVPVGVQKAFQDRYPDAEEVFWVKGEHDFRASFFENGLSREIRYSPTGQWLCACTYLELADLPSTIREFLARRFPDWEIPSVLFKMEHPDHSVCYRVHFDLPEGMLELTFNPKGVLLREKLDSIRDE